MKLYSPNSFFDDLIRGRVNIGADTFKALLLTELYTYNAAHTRRSDVIAWEVAATNGYVTGGQTVTITSTINAPNTEYLFGSATHGTGNIKAKFQVFYKARGGAASADEILAIVDFGTWIQPTGPLACPAQLLSLRSVA
jgi:hypothetical protein